MKPVSPEDWTTINEVFHELVGQSITDAESVLQNRFPNRPTVRQEVLSLLAHAEGGSFLRSPLTDTHMMESVLKKQLDRFTLNSGDRVGDFLILRELGRGSFGTVYLAHQLSLDREVALKISPNFGEEARTMAPLDHPNIVKIFSETIDTERDLRLLCMQYIEGNTLESTCPASVDEALSIGIQLANALAYAHRKNVLHLDVKPGNVLVQSSGKPLLMDFNVALKTQLKNTGDRAVEGPKVLGGTLNYMSPEHLAAFKEGIDCPADHFIDGRSDIYSLGVLLKEMVQNFPVPEGLNKVLEKCTASDPKQRFATATDVAKALSSVDESREIAEMLPRPGRVMQLTLARPYLSIVVFILTPQLFASLMNIGYNWIIIVSELNATQQALFQKLLGIVNPLIYAPAFFIVDRSLAPVRRFLNHPALYLATKSGEQIEALRKHVIKIPDTVAAVVTAGWAAGFVCFPTLLHLLTGPVGGHIFFHFLVSFVLSCLVALTYSFLYTQFMLLQVVYPVLFPPGTEIRKVAGKELEGLEPRVRLFHYAAGFVPLLSALLILATTPTELTIQKEVIFRIMITALICLGAAGLVIGVKVTGILSQTLYALTGARSSLLDVSLSAKKASAS